MLNHSIGKAWIAVALASAATWPCPAEAQNGGLSGQLDSAEQKLGDDIRACRPIDVNDYLRLQAQASANIRAAQKAQKAGLPVDINQVAADSERATQLVERAQSAAARPCPPPNQQPAQTAPPQPNPPPPPPPPANGFLTAKGQPVGPPDRLDELEDQADDAVDEFWEAVDHCNKDGMKAALDRLREIARQAHALHQAAAAAGKFSKYNAADIREMMDLEDDIDDFIEDSARAKPKCPLPEQPKAQTAPNCPTPKPQPQTPREPLLIEPLKLKLGYVPRLSGTLYSYEMLDYHNGLRLEFGSPALRWDPKLAAGAANYARTLTEIGQLQHAPRTGRENERENLSLGRHGANSLQTMLDGWGREMRFYQPGAFPNVSSDGNWMSVAHYTQMVWPTTMRVGCGFYAGARYDALVCRYSPPGNTDGKPLVSPNPCFPLLSGRAPQFRPLPPPAPLPPPPPPP